MLTSRQEDIINNYKSYYKGIKFVVDQDYASYQTRITAFALNTKEMVSTSCLVDAEDELAMGRIMLDLVDQIANKITKEKIEPYKPATEVLRQFREKSIKDKEDAIKASDLGIF